MYALMHHKLEIIGTHNVKGTITVRSTVARSELWTTMDNHQYTKKINCEGWWLSGDCAVWWSGRALVAQARPALGSIPTNCQIFIFPHNSKHVFTTTGISSTVFAKLNSYFYHALTQW